MSLDRGEAIEKIMVHFGWDRMLKTMEALDWKWAGSGKTKIPSIYEIHKCALRLLDDAWDTAYRNEVDAYISTGGLRATAEWDKENKEMCALKLEFIVTQFSDYSDLYGN